MPHIILTEEQARVVVEADGAVEVRDRDNRLLASLTPLSADQLGAENRTRRNGGHRAPDAEQTPTSPLVTPHPEDATSPALELLWSKARRKIRAATTAYSEQTHADY
jgi:hypothetical protein